MTWPDAAEVVGAIADSYDFSRYPVVVDVGGGAAALLAEILRRSPRIRGVLAGPPEVIERASPALADAGLLDRCDLHTGDFLAGVPRGDAHLLMSVLHDRDDEDSAAILARCRDAAGLSGRVIIVERVLPDLLDGPGRTAGELDRLLALAGLLLRRIIPTGTQYCVIEAVFNG